MHCGPGLRVVATEASPEQLLSAEEEEEADDDASDCPSGGESETSGAMVAADEDDIRGTAVRSELPAMLPSSGPPASTRKEVGAPGAGELVHQVGAAAARVGSTAVVATDAVFHRSPEPRMRADASPYSDPTHSQLTCRMFHR
jgi:hypothetical protein